MQYASLLAVLALISSPLLVCAAPKDANHPDHPVETVVLPPGVTLPPVQIPTASPQRPGDTSPSDDTGLAKDVPEPVPQRGRPIGLP